MPTPSFILPTSVPVVDASVEALRVYDGSPAGFDVLPMSFTRGSSATRTDSAGNVVSAVPYNLLNYSEQFDNAAWTKVNTSVSANTSTAPNGTLTADTMSISDINSRIIQSPSLGPGTYTLSAYVKVLSTTTAGSMRFAPTIDGGNVNSIFTPTTEWARYTQTFTVNTVFTSVAVRGLSGGFVGDIALWGVQLVLGTEPLPYQETVTRLALPRLDYRNADGTLSSTPRLLLEPQRTNSIRNSTMVGAVAGTPGTLPTNWARVTGAGLTQTVAGIGTENGLQYIDYRLSGTASSGFAQLNLEGTTQIAALNGQTWTFSTYLKTISGTPDNYRLGMIERNAVGTIVKTVATNAFPTTTLSQFVYSRAVDGGATVAFVQPVFYMTLTNGETYDFTIRIAAPQMELGAFATTFIPTSTAAVTRLVDMGTNSFLNSLQSNQILSTQGTFFIETELLGVQTNRTVWNLGNLFMIVVVSDGRTGLRVEGGVGAYIGLSNTGTGRHKFIVKYTTNSVTFFRNGVQVGSLSLPTPFSPDSFSIFNPGFGIGVPQAINQSFATTELLTDADCIAKTTL
jgi:hypothetical protein